MRVVQRVVRTRCDCYQFTLGFSLERARLIHYGATVRKRFSLRSVSLMVENKMAMVENCDVALFSILLVVDIRHIPNALLDNEVHSF